MNGILLVNKSEGYTSRDVVNKVSKIFKTKKVGHTGTLDPNASGVLVLCIGKALKIVDMITSYNKEYLAKIRLGYETDTLDSTGAITKQTNNTNIKEEDIIKVLNSYIGKYNQEVPKYSAIRVNGKRLYEYAREGLEVTLPKREVTINSLELIGKIEYGKYIEFSIKCNVSKGTYIRSLIRDIGLSLNSYGTMISLTRTKQGNFKIEDSYTLGDIENNNYKLLNIEDVLNYKKVIVSSDIEFKIRNGCILNKFFDEDKAMIMNENNELLAIYENTSNGMARVYKML